MEEYLKPERYKGHKIYFIRYVTMIQYRVRYWIDEVGEGRTGHASNKDEAFAQAKRVIDNE
jgi:hypothetical protein